MFINTTTKILAALVLSLPLGVAQAVNINVFSNGSFETNGGVNTSNSATSWLGAASGYTISSDAQDGSFSMRLASPAFNAAVALQNSVDNGLNPILDPSTWGTTPTLSFYAKGFAGGTGNVLFALRYLDSVGNILANSGNVFFQGSINTSTWTNITLSSLIVPVGATAVFLEYSQGIGPIEPPNLLAGEVLIDNVSLVANVVPVPAAVWLFGSALGVMGVMRRKGKIAA